MKKTMKMLTALLVLLGGRCLAQDGYGEIRGQILSKDGEKLAFAVVKIMQGKNLVGGATADEEGNYKYKPLTPGYYELTVFEVSHQVQPVNKIKVIPNEATYVNVHMTPNTIPGVTITAEPIDYTQSGIDKNMFVFKSLDSKEVFFNASSEHGGDVRNLLAAVSSDAYQDKNGELHVRGSRGEATGYFIDGVRVLKEASVPGPAIENITFFTGGVPAMYGDLMSGAALITTKGYFSGLREKNIRMAEWEEEERAAKAWREELKEKAKAEREKNESEK